MGGGGRRGPGCVDHCGEALPEGDEKIAGRPFNTDSPEGKKILNITKCPQNKIVFCNMD